MRCLKCGRETENEQVFCNECLKDAKNYPVKPGTAVHLHNRASQEEPKKKAYHRRTLPPEEQLLILHKAVRWLLATTAVLAVALGVVAAMFLYELAQPNPIQPRDLGRNYTTSATSGD